jgi:hypothetical protein
LCLRRRHLLLRRLLPSWRHVLPFDDGSLRRCGLLRCLLPPLLPVG